MNGVLIIEGGPIAAIPDAEVNAMLKAFAEVQHSPLLHFWRYRLKDGRDVRWQAFAPAAFSSACDVGPDIPGGGAT